MPFEASRASSGSKDGRQMGSDPHALHTVPLLGQALKWTALQSNHLKDNFRRIPKRVRVHRAFLRYHERKDEQETST
jgi:hypothetical protein